MSETSSFEQFKETFDAYFAKWWKAATILMLLVYLLAFGLYTLAICDKHLDLALPSFLRAIITFEYWSWMNDTMVDAIGIGFIAVGALTLGVVSIGACSVGVIAMGACSVGIVAFGAFSVGVVAFGGNSFGIIAIGAGTRHGYEVGPRGRFDIGRAVGVIAIGPKACGVYTLSYEGKGTHMLSPDRQDLDAVALFTRWLPKFKGAFERMAHSPS